MRGAELFRADGISVGVFYCEQCRFVKRSKAEADACCVPLGCEQCGGVIELDNRTLCDACRASRAEALERKRFLAADKVSGWKGPVFYGDCGHQGGYFDSLDSLLDYLACYELPVPDYVWTSNQDMFCQLEIDRIIENACQDAYEDWDRRVSGFPELKVAIEQFNKANEDLVTYTPNYKAAFLIGEDAGNAEDGKGRAA